MERYNPLFEKTENPQINTPEFKKWFGKSKVVDSHGKPLVVYHGSTASFNNFDLGKIGTSTDTGMFGNGFYFSKSSKYASLYARGNGSVYPVYLSIQNPYIMNSQDDIPKINIPNETINDLKNSAINYSKEFKNFILTNHYDGVISNFTDEIVVFHPNQIKSAIGNNGKFSKSSNNINESYGKI